MSEIPRFWRNRDVRYRLQGEICPNGHVVFPPRDICPNCNREASEPYILSGKGEVFSSTVVYEAPSEFAKYTPYQIAHIKLDEGPIITAQLTDLEDPTTEVPIGTKVEHVTRVLSEQGEQGIINYGYKFRRPVSSS